MNEDTTQDSLRSIDNDLLSILSARGCPVPPRAAQSRPDASQGYKGTAEDFGWALEMRREAAQRATERDPTEAREWAESSPTVSPNDPVARIATEFLRKMQVAEDCGLAEWDGTNWRLKPKPSARPTTENREYPRFSESMTSSHFHKARKVGHDHWKACCPAHDDHNPSLSITRGKTHWLFTCWSHGCTWLDIVHAAGLDGFDFRIAS